MKFATITVIRVRALTSLLFSSCAKAQNTERTVSTTSANSAEGENARSVPIEVVGNLIFLQARVNNSEPLWFILDSGATDSGIDPSRARALGLRVEGTSRVSGAGENSTNVCLARGVSLSGSGANFHEG